VVSGQQSSNKQQATSRKPETGTSGQWSVGGGQQDRAEERTFAGNWKPETGNLLVIWAAGPWQESGEWWSENPWVREVWDIAVDQAGAVALYRIFRDVMRDEWFVEASFD